MANPSDVVAIDNPVHDRLQHRARSGDATILRDALHQYYAPSHPGKPPGEYAAGGSDHEAVACLFASWKDGTYWIGEVRGDRNRGLHVNWRAGRDKCETRARGDANDRAATVAESLDFLMTLRAAEVESSFATDGPPDRRRGLRGVRRPAQDGEPAQEARASLAESGPTNQAAWLPWVMSPLTLLVSPAFAVLRSALSPGSRSSPGWPPGPRGRRVFRPPGDLADQAPSTQGLARMTPRLGQRENLT